MVFDAVDISWKLFRCRTAIRLPVWLQRLSPAYCSDALCKEIRLPLNIHAAPIGKESRVMLPEPSTAQRHGNSTPYVTRKGHGIVTLWENSDGTLSMDDAESLWELSVITRGLTTVLRFRDEREAEGGGEEAGPGVYI